MLPLRPKFPKSKERTGDVIVISSGSEELSAETISDTSGDSGTQSNIEVDSDSSEEDDSDSSSEESSSSDESTEYSPEDDDRSTDDEREEYTLSE